MATPASLLPRETPSCLVGNFHAIRRLTSRACVAGLSNHKTVLLHFPSSPPTKIVDEAARRQKALNLAGSRCPTFFTALQLCMQRWSSYEHLSVWPSVKRVNCDKTKKY